MRDRLCLLFAVCALNVSVLASAATVSSADDPLIVPSSLPAPEADAAGLPARVAQVNKALGANLQSFICNEKIERYKGSLSGEKSHQIDTITSKLAFESGEERYTDIFQNKKRLPQISALSGAWSQGEYGTLLQQTRSLFASKPVVFRQKTKLNDTAADIYSFDVDAQETPWDLSVKGKIYKIPFRTYVWVAQDTAEILKIARVSKEIDSETGISKITWFVTLETTDLGGKAYLVPKAGQYAVSYAWANKCEWNTVSFSDYHRFGSESTLRFDVNE